jgi:hypothetical protein
VTETDVAAEVILATQGGDPTLTRTLAPVDADTAGVLPTALPSVQPTTPAAVAALPSPPPGSAPVATIPGSDAPSVPIELLVGGGVLLAVMGYAGLFWRGVVIADRYANGFVAERCPVCERGTLSIETRINRILGVPRVKRTVRCDACRSVLREVGTRRWRYAIDRMENPALFNQYNNRVIDDTTLAALANPDGSQPRPPAQPPEFIDE